MLLTPPDAISQTMLAVPVYLLYETGLLMARLFGPTPESSDEESVELGSEGGGE
jgi:sec-independent protein translocase protein TatC